MTGHRLLPDYDYHSRAAAELACEQEGYDGLCTMAEVEGHAESLVEVFF